MEKKSDYGIIGTKILLKVLEEKDLDRVFIWKNNIELNRLIEAHPIPVARHEMCEWYKRNQSDKNQIIWGIYQIKTTSLIGIVRLMFIDWISKTAEFGIYIGDKSYTGKGIGKEVLKLVIDFSFYDLNLHKIHLKVSQSNTRAINLYKSYGFKKEGVLREHFWNNGKYEDILVMGLLEKEHAK